jgi:hypothetical protein
MPDEGIFALQASRSKTLSCLTSGFEKNFYISALPNAEIEILG